VHSTGADNKRITEIRVSPVILELMHSFLYSVAGFIVALGILVAVHEFGHYWVARKLGVKVLKFSIGFGKVLWSRRGGADNTEYAIGAIPLGGYVKMLDETEGDVPESERHRAFNRQGLPTRAAVVLAGPAFNFLFAIAAYWLVFCIGTEGLSPVVGTITPNSIAERSGLQSGDKIIAVNGRPNRTWSENRLYMFDAGLAQRSIDLDVVNDAGAERKVSLDLSGLDPRKVDSGFIERGIGMWGWRPEPPAQLGQVVDGSPASLAGLREGDTVLSVDGKTVTNWTEMVGTIAPNPDKALQVKIRRDDGSTETVTLTPERIELDDSRAIGRIGVGNVFVPMPEDMIVRVRAGPVDGLVQGVSNTWLMSKLTVSMLWRMLKLEVSPKNISGPVTIARYAGATAQVGFEQFFMFLAVVSISLGVLNLLPIPILDGGHLLYYVVEAIKGSPVSDQVLLWGQQIGILLLGALMCLAFYNDITQLLN